MLEIGAYTTNIDVIKSCFFRNSSKKKPTFVSNLLLITYKYRYMHSFKSKHFPTTNKPFMVVQEAAMYYYAIISVFVMLGIILLMQAGKEILWFAMFGFSLAIFLGNVLARVKLRKMYAEIFFAGEHVSLISVYDILFPKQKEAFPLRFANPGRSHTSISFHFNDQIVVLNREDWEEFDLIWEAFFDVNQEVI